MPQSPRVGPAPVAPDIEQYRGRPLADFLAAFLGYVKSLTRYLQELPAGKPPFIWVQAPIGGIPALSGTTPGSATCTEYLYTSATSFATTGGSTLTVYNAYPVAVGASKLVGAVYFKGQYWALTEQC
jgi:hypothetical protein